MGALTQVLIETESNNSPQAYYIYGLGLAQRISAVGTVATYHYNIQGSTVALTDSSGNITDSYAYDSFGVLANYAEVSPQPFRYLGRYGIVDDRTGLLNARARYFTPQLGRFLTRDPVIERDSDGQSLNRYIYALNNAIRLSDISGFSPRDAIRANSNDPFQTLYDKLIGSGCPISSAEDIRRCRLNTIPGESVDFNIAFAAQLRAEIEGPPRSFAEFINQIVPTEVRRLVMFYYLVANRKPWDYKQRDIQPDGFRPYESFGNFNYGATGTALGISPELLGPAAGVAAFIAGTAEIQNGLPFISPRNGDNSVDQFWIQRGIIYYYESHK